MDVLALDVVGFQERLTFLWCVISHVEILHGPVLVRLYLIAHGQHTCTAGAARHLPEIHVEHVTFVRFDDALEDAVTLGQRLVFHHLDLILLNEFTKAQNTLSNQFRMRDKVHGASKVISNHIILSLIPSCVAEKVEQHHHLDTKVVRTDVQFFL